ncbi:MAG: SRPBCC family protein [Candidatus Terrybacteria bacterium]|nr:SRPBCC family protein [Candidatus Terrybacteria bacterium]
MTKTTRHYEERVAISTTPEEVFAYVDDHTRFSSHMTKPSWMMGGGHMDVSVDAGRGQQVGSHIRLRGKAFGFPLFLDEVITRHEPPRRKSWETVGAPKLLVVGKYRMDVEVVPQEGASGLRVAIDYDLPPTKTWLGKLFGQAYAKWCVRKILNDARERFLSQS